MKLNIITKAIMLALPLFIINTANAQYMERIIIANEILHLTTTPSTSDVTITNSTSNLPPSSSTAIISSSPMPYVFTTSSYDQSVSGPGLGPVFGSAGAVLAYDFSLNGTPNTIVPLNFASAFKLTSSNSIDSSGLANVDLVINRFSSGFINSSAVFFDINCSYYSCSENISKSNNDISLTLDGVLIDGFTDKTTLQMYGSEFDEYFRQGLFSGTLILKLDEEGMAIGEVTLQAFTNAGGKSNVSAFIDPYFFIDSSFLDENPNTTLSFTQGVGNAPPNPSAVPVPAALPLMASALGIFGIARRRNKAKAA